MSKKYDEYKGEILNNINNLYTSKNVVPMIPDMDKTLDNEIRDRAIIELVKNAIAAGKELSYGDIRLMLDGDLSEKEYEIEQIKHHTR